MNVSQAMDSKNLFDIIIVGGGLTGLTIANSLAKTNNKVALVSPVVTEPDGRSTALLAHSVEYLDSIGAWEKARPKSAPMSLMRIIDDTNRLFHAPEISFKSMEIGLEAFGYNILNTDLSEVLGGKLKDNQSFVRIDGKITNIDEADGVRVELQSGEVLQSRVIVGADGRNSIVRRMADNGKGIGTREWKYPQSAIVLNFEHALPHGDASTEFHTPSGPFTVVPLAEGISSLVWVVTPQEAMHIMERKTQILERNIEDQMHSILGKVKVITKVQSFPLSAMSVKKLAIGKSFLVGDAAHGFPPIGAQGYNLGIRDIEELTRLLTNGIGNPGEIARRYNANRKADVISRTISVDVFNRSLLTDFLPVQVLRAGGITALRELGPLRKFMMREGVSPGMGVRGFSDAFRDFAKCFRPVKANS